jgi:hypothetical protein
LPANAANYQVLITETSVVETIGVNTVRNGKLLRHGGARVQTGLLSAAESG